MNRLRQLVQSRSRAGLLAVYVAYSLAIQAVVASVGLGMSASAALERDNILCSFAFNKTANVPVRDDDRQRPSPAPQCPFCFVAAQSTGDAATVGETAAFPAYAGVQIADALSGHAVNGNFIPQFRRNAGEPRAPPLFSV
jgi:hypothetical protein